MKPVGDFAVGEYVRPIIPKFYVTGPYPFVSDCGGMFMNQMQEYHVSRKFESVPRAAKAQVMLEDGYKLGFLLDWHTPVLGRYEGLPEGKQLASVMRTLHENNILLMKEFLATLPEKVRLPTLKHRPGDRVFFLKKQNLAAAGSLAKQPRLCISMFNEMENADMGVLEVDLMEMYHVNAARFNSVQDAWKIFLFYLSEFKKIGLVEVDE